MPRIYGRTREQLRKSIGRNLIGHRLIVSAASSDGDTTGLIDGTLLGGDDNYNGWWFVATSMGANGGHGTSRLRLRLGEQSSTELDPTTAGSNGRQRLVRALAL